MEPRILKNIFINTSGNNLRLCEIHFNDKITDVKLLSGEIRWEDISTSEKKKEFIGSLNLPEAGEADKSIDGNFNLIMPGAIDPHVHFDTPGFEFRDDFEHGSTAAAFGGVTTIIDMPCTSLPPVTNRNNFQTKLDALQNRSLIDFAFWGGVRGNDFCKTTDIEKQIMELAEAGVAAFKVYVISGMDTFTDLTYERIREAAETIAKTGKPMGVHAEDKQLVVSRRSRFQAEGKNDWQAYCNARDVSAEVTAVKEIIEIAKETGVRAHIVHLSSGEGLKVIEDGKSKGINISAETCPHYLYFTQEDFKNDKIRNFLKTAPPVKFEADKTKLWEGLANGSLNFVTTDHAGCIPEKEKISENFWKVYGGIPGVEHRVPFLFSEGFLNNNLTLEQTINLLSTNVATFFGLTNKGKIEKGKDADFALIDLWKSEIIKSENMHSLGKYTPFENIEVNAVVESTVLRGKFVMNKSDKAEVNVGYGNFIPVET